MRPKITFGQALDNWLVKAKDRMKESSYVQYYHIVHHYLKPGLGHYAPAEITSPVFNAFIVSLVKGDDDGAVGISRQSLQSVLSIANTVLKAEQGNEKVNAVTLLPKKEEKSVQLMTKEEQLYFENYLRKNIDEKNLGILLCLHMGIQLGEICALRWGDIDLDGKTPAIKVQRNMYRVAALGASGSAKTKVIEMTHKPPLLRTVPIPAYLMDMMTDFQRTDADAYLLSGTSSRFVEPRTLDYHIKSCLKHSLVKPNSFRALRYTFIARSIESGVDLMTLSKILGYADIKAILTVMKKCNATSQSESLSVKGYAGTAQGLL